MAGLTSSGFDRPTLEDLILKLQNRYKAKFGQDFDVSDDVIFGQVIKVLADSENDLYQLMEMVYNTQTISGAEAIFLDEIFAKQGIFREGATKGSGKFIIEFNNTRPNNIVFDGSLIGSTVDHNYITNGPQNSVDDVLGFVFDVNQMTVGQSYTLNFTNQTTTETSTLTVTLLTAEEQDKLAVVGNVLTFFNRLLPNDQDKIVTDSTGLVVYVGFTFEEVFVGVTSPFGFQIVPAIGRTYSEFDCVATEAGYKATRVGQINSIVPTPTDFSEIFNNEDFSTGSDIETDAEFFQRAMSVTDNPASSTRPALVSRMFELVPAIQKIKFNKTITEIPSVGTFATVEPIIIGGEDQAIGEALYSLQSVQTTFQGDQVVTVSTSDFSTEAIRFSRATENQKAIRITYKTEDSTALTDDEKEDISTNLINLSTNWNIGDLLFNTQMEAAVFSATPYGRFIALKVELKNANSSDSAYSDEDYQAGPKELPALQLANIFFVQTF